MTSAPYFGQNTWSPSNAVWENVGSVLLPPALTVIRHIRCAGTATYTAYPTGVVGDDGNLWGIVAVSPSSAPGVPTVANAASWAPGFWGRPTTTAVEALQYVTTANIYSRRVYFEVEFDCNFLIGAGGGTIYLGYTALYQDANHVKPTVDASLAVWGYSLLQRDAGTFRYVLQRRTLALVPGSSGDCPLVPLPRCRVPLLVLADCRRGT